MLATPAAKSASILSGKESNPTIKAEIVPIKASENISKLENVKFIIVENSKHEILNQDTRTFVLSEIHYWFKENNLI